jgi:hypothetical protein
MKGDQQMSKSSNGGGIGIGTIIFIAFIAYSIFGGDDEDKKEVDIKSEDGIVSEETKKDIEKKVEEAITSAKEAYEELVEEFDKQLKEKEGEEIDKTQDQQTSKKEVVERRQEKEKKEVLKPMEERPKEEVEFKRL